MEPNDAAAPRKRPRPVEVCSLRALAWGNSRAVRCRGPSTSRMPPRRLACARRRSVRYAWSVWEVQVNTVLFRSSVGTCLGSTASHCGSRWGAAVWRAPAATAALTTKLAQESKTCPQCKAQARERDVRRLFTSRVLVVDTTAQEEAQQQLRKERATRQRVRPRAVPRSGAVGHRALMRRSVGAAGGGGDACHGPDRDVPVPAPGGASRVG